MNDWKQDAKDAYERLCEGIELQEAEHKKNRIEGAREKLIEALQALNIPLPADAEIRIEDHEDDAELGTIPFVVIEGVEFTHGPRGNDHGGGLGIVTTCPRCQSRVRGPYLHAKEILGRELLNTERVSHVCETEEEKLKESALDAQIAASEMTTESSEQRLLDALRDVIDDRIQERTGA
jgi:hypothetical protein